MGLDMYLFKYRKFENTTPAEIYAIEQYLEWKNNPRAKGESMKNWTGIPYERVPKGKKLEFYKHMLRVEYSDYDAEKKWPWYRIKHEIGYWRKANQVHSWFVENVQGGEDDCGDYIVTKEKLQELLDICIRLKNELVLVPGRVCTGESYVDGKWQRLYRDGSTIGNPELAEELLPSCDGFFFGSTEYGEWYYEDIVQTVDILTKVIEETDWENEVVFYSSSW